MSAFIKIAIIGSGNVARYFGRGLKQASWRPHLFARQASEGFEPLQKLYKNPEDYDLVLLCVSDDAIGQVSQQLPAGNAIVAHVSGATPLEAIDGKHSRRAVFYPLMSIRPGLEIPLHEIPFCLEAEEPDDLNILEGVVKNLGAKSYRVSSAQRPYLHLAAVYSHNFSNHLFQKAFEILQRQQMEFSMLLPLLEQSLKRLHEHEPKSLQTGPAVRHDRGTMERHRELLSKPIDKEIYSLLSNSIQQTNDEKL